MGNFRQSVHFPFITEFCDRCKLESSVYFSCVVFTCTQGDSSLGCELVRKLEPQRVYLGSSYIWSPTTLEECSWVLVSFLVEDWPGM